eukprot:TRINITY_DN3254_c0_g2_i2.p1 TRINITY_DN3254_c0_g2~~TRINITY_DN3254_c0_g2_i2.p1  ORF type:complete len:310 (+),score=55.01 TRINITY_DN3254_c0_g2_i2:56-985(+)
MERQSPTPSPAPMMAAFPVSALAVRADECSTAEKLDMFANQPQADPTSSPDPEALLSPDLLDGGASVDLAALQARVAFAEKWALEQCDARQQAEDALAVYSSTTRIGREPDRLQSRLRRSRSSEARVLVLAEELSKMAIKPIVRARATTPSPAPAVTAATPPIQAAQKRAATPIEIPRLMLIQHSSEIEQLKQKLTAAETALKQAEENSTKHENATRVLKLRLKEAHKQIDQLTEPSKPAESHPKQRGRSAERRRSSSPDHKAQQGTADDNASLQILRDTRDTLRRALVSARVRSDQRETELIGRIAGT